MPTDNTIDYIELPAANLDAVKKFYGNTFGFSFQDYGSDYCAFNDGRLDGGFYTSDKKSSRSEGAALIVLYATDLEDTLNRVAKNGGTIVQDIFSFPGGRRFHFADPHGNELAVWSDK